MVPGLWGVFSDLLVLERFFNLFRSALLRRLYHKTKAPAVTKMCPLSAKVISLLCRARRLFFLIIFGCWSACLLVLSLLILCISFLLVFGWFFWYFIWLGFGHVGMWVFGTCIKFPLVFAPIRIATSDCFGQTCYRVRLLYFLLFSLWSRGVRRVLGGYFVHPVSRFFLFSTLKYGSCIVCTCDIFSGFLAN